MIIRDIDLEPFRKATSIVYEKHGKGLEDYIESIREAVQ